MIYELLFWYVCMQIVYLFAWEQKPAPLRRDPRFEDAEGQAVRKASGRTTCH